MQLNILTLSILGNFLNIEMRHFNMEVPGAHFPRCSGDTTKNALTCAEQALEELYYFSTMPWYKQQMVGKALLEVRALQAQLLATGTVGCTNPDGTQIKFG